MSDFLATIPIFVIVAALVYLGYRLDKWMGDKGLPRRQGIPKSEIQTLFHGNTKDQDQI